MVDGIGRLRACEGCTATKSPWHRAPHLRGPEFECPRTRARCLPVTSPQQFPADGGIDVLCLGNLCVDIVQEVRFIGLCDNNSFSTSKPRRLQREFILKTAFVVLTDTMVRCLSSRSSRNRLLTSVLVTLSHSDSSTSLQHHAVQKPVFCTSRRCFHIS